MKIAMKQFTLLVSKSVSLAVQDNEHKFSNPEKMRTMSTTHTLTGRLK